MSAEFEAQCAHLLASWKAILRATRAVDPEQQEALVEALRQRLAILAPIESLKLVELLEALEVSGMPAAQREASLLFLHQRGGDLGVPCDLPPELASMAPGERRRSVQGMAKKVAVELAEIADEGEDDWRDRTPTINMKDLVVNDPAVRTASLQAIGGHYIGQTFTVDGAAMTIGRGEDADIHIDDEGVSRHHAKIVKVGKDHLLVDLGSRNGLIVNGFGVTEHELEDGDRVQLGATTILRFAYHDQLEQDFQQRVLSSVSIDAVTGVVNRRFFLEQLRSECAWCSRHDVDLSYLALGIDSYDTVVEKRGHAARDAVLKVTAQQLKKTLRVEDVLGRTADGTFGLILRGINEEGALAVADRLRHLVEEAVIRVGERTLLSTIAVGAATFEPDQADVAVTLRQKAETRLLLAQKTGNVVVSEG